MATTAVTEHSHEQAGPRPSHGNRRIPWGRIFAWTAMAVLMLITLFLYWMLRTALSSNAALYAGSASLLPVGFSFDGFARVFGLQTGAEAIAAGGSGQAIDFWRYLINSVIVATLVTAGQVFFSGLRGLCVLPAALARTRRGLWLLPRRPHGAGDLSLSYRTSCSSSGSAWSTHSLGHRLTRHADDTVRRLLLAPVLHERSRGTRRGRAPGRHLEAGVFFRLIIPMSAAPLSTLTLLTYIASERLLLASYGELFRQLPATGRCQPCWVSCWSRLLSSDRLGVG